MSIRADGGPDRVNWWAQGTVIFAVAMLAIIGFVEVFQGIAAIGSDDVLVRAPGYVYRLSTTGWGWIHLIMGIVFIVTALAIPAGSMFARWFGIALAVIAIILNFLWLPYYPLWAIIIIVFNVVLIWALTRYIAEA